MAHVGEFHRWTTALNVKLLLPPRQSRGASLGRLAPIARPMSSAPKVHCFCTQVPVLWTVYGHLFRDGGDRTELAEASRLLLA